MKFRNGIILGLLIGVGAAFLYAPKSGKETREDLKEKLNKVPQSFLNLLESLVDLSVSVLDLAKESLEEQSDRLSNVVNKGMSYAKDKTEKIKSLATSISKN